ncbi:hypothetical protein HZA33_03195 [Candidatus Pacearchaeota archaeon]|nr:hypothetical protein [Candidatus Pacearchaeota archaeon]
MVFKRLFKKVAVASALATALILFTPSKVHALETEHAVTSFAPTQQQIDEKEREKEKKLQEIEDLLDFDKEPVWLESLNTRITDPKDFEENVVKKIQKLKNVSMFIPYGKDVSINLSSFERNYTSSLYFKGDKTKGVLDLVSLREFMHGRGPISLTFQHQFSSKIATQGSMSIGKRNYFNLSTSFQLNPKDKLTLFTTLNEGNLSSYRLQGNVSKLNLDYLYGHNQSSTELNLHTIQKIGNKNLEATYRMYERDKRYTSYRFQFKDNKRFQFALAKPDFADKPGLEAILQFPTKKSGNFTLSTSIGDPKTSYYGLGYQINKKGLSLSTNFNFTQGKIYEDIRFGFSKEF